VHTSGVGQLASPRLAATAARDDRLIADHNVIQSITRHIYPYRCGCAIVAFRSAKVASHRQVTRGVRVEVAQ
jgi:hypothetical protein